MLEEHSALLVLIDPAKHKSWTEWLKTLGIRAKFCSEEAKVSAMMANEKFDVAIVQDTGGDQKLEEWFGEIKKQRVETSVLVLLKELNSVRAVELMKKGAQDCLEPGFEGERLAKSIQRAIEVSRAVLHFPYRPPFWKKRWFLGLCFFAFVVAPAAFAFKLKLDRKHRAEKAEREYRSVKTYRLPYYHPAAAAFHDGYFWISDWYTQAIYKHLPEEKNFDIATVYHFAEINPASFCWAGDDLWVVSTNRKIQRYRLKDKLVLIFSTKAPGANPSGIAFDGHSIWTSDSETRKIYKHVIDDALSVEKTFEYPGQPLALLYDDGTLYSINGLANEILVHRIGEDQIFTERAIPLKPAQVKHLGFAFAAERFWTVSDAPSAIHRQEIARDR